MRVEKITTTSRLELLIQIEAFIKINGWRTKKINDELLLAADEIGSGLSFNFIKYSQDPNYGYAARSSIGSYANVSDDFSTHNHYRVAYFRFKDLQNEINSGFLIGDSQNLIIYLDFENKYNLFFVSGYLKKSHEFNGGQIAFSSVYPRYNSGYNWGGYYDNSMSSSSIPFSNNSKTVFLLGGVWRDLERGNQEDKKISTNLCAGGEISKLSAVSLLDIGKSSLSGLYTLITPNFYYKNNRNIWVHAGEFDLIRVLKDEPRLINRFENGQIFHFGSEKFMVLRPHKKDSSDGISNLYTMAVKID